MADYTNFKRGSEWRKWDLHIHTPLSIIQEYGGPKEWDKYIDALEHLPSEVKVIGINDYYFIDGYEKVMEYRAKGRLQNLDKIFPVLEFRIDTFGTGSENVLHKINLHVLFDLEETKIQSEIAKVKKEFIELIPISGEDKYKTKMLTRENLITEGGNDLRNGFNNLIPPTKKVLDLIASDTWKNRVFVLFGYKEWASLEKNQQLKPKKVDLFSKAHAFFSSNKDTIANNQTWLNEYGDKRLLHSGDHHSFITLDTFNKDKYNNIVLSTHYNCNTWIKADPTFEGLQQIRYEPEDRVKIQAEKPDSKNEYHVIDSIEFIDASDFFGNQKIFLNENLNAVIGGKSSGKSLLLYSIASSIDPEQVATTSKRLNFEGYQFNTEYDFKVKWRDNDEDILTEKNDDKKNHKIIYIPQLYINHLVEKNNKVELNKLISSILLQDAEFKIFFEKQKELISEINSEINSILAQYLSTRENALNLQSQIREAGELSKLEKAVNDINSRIKTLQTTNRFSSEETTEYEKLSIGIKSIESEQNEQKKKIEILQRITNEILATGKSLFGLSGNLPGVTLKGKIDVHFNTYSAVPNDLLAIRQVIEKDYKLLENNLAKAIKDLNLEEENKVLEKRRGELEAQLVPYNRKIENQKDLTRLLQLKVNEEAKYERAKNNDIVFKTHIEDLRNLRLRITNLLKERVEHYELIVKTVNETKSEIGDEIKLTSKLIQYKEKFAFFNQVNKNNIEKNHLFYTYFVNDLVKYDEIPDLFAQPLRILDDKLIYSKDKHFPMRVNNTLADVLWGLVEDQFEIDFTVKYLGDNLLNMSPGKKGTVLLILFLQISSSEYPILIDQPEDNLDNRTIYDLLCTMIKNKKKERQIIIVSHNANLVVATDAENIIVANQKGQNAITDESPYRFEYVNGSLEHSFINGSKKLSILRQQGIRQHVCDILEGGDEAFKQRERKYAIKL